MCATSRLRSISSWMADAGCCELEPEGQQQPETETCDHGDEHDLLALGRGRIKRYVGLLDNARVWQLKILRLGGLLVARQ